jgi:DNA transformation protein and related proteins
VAGDSFHEFVRELFAKMGPITVKRMFGGAGVYTEGLMFALLSDDVIHIKVDGALKSDLIAEGCGPFVWTPRQGPRAGEQIDLGYWRLPEAALDDPDLAVEWGRKALMVARAKAGATKRKRSKR